MDSAEEIMDSATSDVDSVTEVSEVEEDLKELKLFLGQAQRPRVKALLEDDIKELESEASAAAEAAKAPEMPVVKEETVAAVHQQKRLPTKKLDTYGGPDQMDSDVIIEDATIIAQDSNHAVKSDSQLQIVNIIKSENPGEPKQIDADSTDTASESDEDVQEITHDQNPAKQNEPSNITSMENLHKMISDVICDLNDDEIGPASGGTESLTQIDSVAKISDDFPEEEVATLVVRNTGTDSDPDWEPEEPKTKRAKKVSVESPVKSTNVVTPTLVVKVVKPTTLGTTGIVKSAAPASVKPRSSVLTGLESMKKNRPPDPREKEFEATITLKSGENIVVAVKERNRQALLKHSATVLACMQQYIADHGLPKHSGQPLFLNLDSLGKPLEKGSKYSNLIGFGRSSVPPEKASTVTQLKQNTSDVHDYCRPAFAQPARKSGPLVHPPEQRQVMPVGLMGSNSCERPTPTGPSASLTSGRSGHGSLLGTARQEPSRYIYKSVNPLSHWSNTETKKLLALYRTHRDDIGEFTSNSGQRTFKPWEKMTLLLNRIPGVHKNSEQVRVKINSMRKSLYKACVVRDSRRHVAGKLPEPSMYLKELYSLFESDLRRQKKGEIKDFDALHEELTRGYTPPAPELVPIKLEIPELPYKHWDDKAHLGSVEPMNTNTSTTPVADAHHDYSCSPTPRKRRRRMGRGKQLELETIKHVQNMMVQSDERLNDTLLKLHAENKRIMEKLIARL